MRAMCVALSGMDAVSWGGGIPVVSHADGARDIPLALASEASRGVTVWIGLGLIS